MPLTYKLAKKILSDIQAEFSHQVGSHEQYKKNNIRITLPKHTELKPKTAKGFLEQIGDSTGQTYKDIIKKYKIKI